MKKRKIVLGEESTIIALGFAKILESSALFEVVAHTERFEKLEEKVAIIKPDVVVVNPMMSGAVRGDSTINTFENSCVVALIYNYVEQNILKQYHGTIDIGDSRQEIENKLKDAIAQLDSKESEKRNSYELSDRETDVLVAVAKGMQNKEIADMLNISIYTVISHRKNIVAKTGIKSVAGLTVYALINNLISESDVM
ncbi:MAG: response regulator transcription factor [Bacteroidales bacterium]|nr:response regulator transcription factor [Bacteroidales bacterium]